MQALHRRLSAYSHPILLPLRVHPADLDDNHRHTRCAAPMAGRGDDDINMWLCDIQLDPVGVNRGLCSDIYGMAIC